MHRIIDSQPEIEAVAVSVVTIGPSLRLFVGLQFGLQFLAGFRGDRMAVSRMNPAVCAVGSGFSIGPDT